MKLFLCILAFSVYSACGYHTHNEHHHHVLRNGYRATYAPTGDSRGKQSFFNIPKTTNEAESAGYKQINNPPDLVKDVTTMCYKGDPRVCALYDRAGTVAGMQLAIATRDLAGLPYDASSKFIKKTLKGADYWTTAYYIASPETIKAGGRRSPLTETIDGIWIPNGDHLMSIPTNEADLASKTIFKKQKCIPNMGMHYYYNMTTEMDCQEFLPYFVLVKDGQVIGLGFTVIGKVVNGERPWFERIDEGYGEIELTIPTAPDCMRTLSTQNGVTNLHMYFIEEPWTITC